MQGYFQLDRLIVPFAKVTCVVGHGTRAIRIQTQPAGARDDGEIMGDIILHEPDDVMRFMQDYTDWLNWHDANAVDQNELLARAVYGIGEAAVATESTKGAIDALTKACQRHWGQV